MKQILLTLFDLGVLGGCVSVAHHVWVRLDWAAATVITVMLLLVVVRVVRDRIQAFVTARHPETTSNGGAI